MTSIIKPKEWESKAALLAHMELSSTKTTIVGIDTEAPRKFYAFSLLSELGLFEIAVLLSGLGTEPEIIQLRTDSEPSLVMIRGLHGSI